jgi:scyllo-inosamine-4-phosphate amidinotransferase 1
MFETKSLFSISVNFKKGFYIELNFYKKSVRIIMSLVNVHNEWDPLEEIIVGTAVNAQVPVKDKGLFAIEYRKYYNNMDEIPSGKYSQKIIEETEEDLQELVSVFEKLGIIVRRPQITDHTSRFSTPDWQSDGLYNYCPRDLLLTVGDMIIETPMTLRCRFLETFAYKDILIEYMKSGAKWISAPKPRLKDNIYNLSDPSKTALNNHEPVFDAANVLRIGKDLLYLLSNTGNELGCQWLQNVLGDNYRVHPCYNLYEEAHIDSTVTLLKPGLVLLNPERVNENNMPEIFKNWNIIWAPEMVDTGFIGKKPYASVWVGLNLLMVNPNLAIIDERQVRLIKTIEKHKIDVIPLQLRHSRTLGGGFHCVTLDVRRKGIFEDYLS